MFVNLFKKRKKQERQTDKTVRHSFCIWSVMFQSQTNSLLSVDVLNCPGAMRAVFPSLWFEDHSSNGGHVYIDIWALANEAVLWNVTTSASEWDKHVHAILSFIPVQSRHQFREFVQSSKAWWGIFCSDNPVLLVHTFEQRPVPHCTQKPSGSITAKHTGVL